MLLRQFDLLLQDQALALQLRLPLGMAGGGKLSIGPSTAGGGFREKNGVDAVPAKFSVVIPFCSIIEVPKSGNGGPGVKPKKLPAS